MTALRFSVGCVMVAGWLPVACSSTDVGIDAAGIDGGASAPPSTNAPGDAGVPGTARPPIRPASRLAVACKGEPCFVAVSGEGGEHVCGLLKDGSVRCWGRDTRPRVEPPPDGEVSWDGALGRGRVVSALEGATPAPVVGLTGATQISVGKNLGTCARTTDGSVYCWGRNEYGQLGRPAEQASLTVPTRVDGLPPVSKVGLGGTTGCAIAEADGALWCWGARDTQIGRGAAAGDSTSFPPQVMTIVRAPVRELAVGTVHGLEYRPFEDTIIALLEGETLATLGESPAGETSGLPFDDGVAPVPFERHRVVRVGAFGYLGSDRVLARWIPDTAALYVPLAETVVDVSITVRRSLFGMHIEQGGVLLSDGRLFRWGHNTGGALGYPMDVVDVAEEPRDMRHVAGDRVVSFATAAASTCVSRVDGNIMCWGTNHHGELGRGTIDFAEHPEAEVIR